MPQPIFGVSRIIKDTDVLKQAIVGAPAYLSKEELYERVRGKMGRPSYDDALKEMQTSGAITIGGDNKVVYVAADSPELKRVIDESIPVGTSEIERLFEIDDARKVFLMLYDREEKGKKGGQEFEGISFNEWATSSTKLYNIQRSPFIEYIAWMKRLGLVTDLGAEQDPPKSIFRMTDSGYKAANILVETSEKLRAIDKKD
jgi:hypothetical protein